MTIYDVQDVVVGGTPRAPTPTPPPPPPPPPAPPDQRSDQRPILVRLPVKLELLPPVEGGAPEAELFVQNVIVTHVHHEVEVVVEGLAVRLLDAHHVGLGGGYPLPYQAAAMRPRPLRHIDVAGILLVTPPIIAGVRQEDVPR